MIDQAEIHRMVRSDSANEQREALNQLHWNFEIETFPDKEQLWKDLIHLTDSNDDNLRRDAADALLFVSTDFPNKEMAWEDLSRLTQDRDSIVRALSTIPLGFVFPSMPKKKNPAWQVLHLLARDTDDGVRGGAAFAIIHSFTKLPNKNHAWCDIILLAHDKNSSVRYQTATAISIESALFSDSFFHDVPDKDQAWNEIIQMINDEDIIVQMAIMNAPRYIFPHIPNKEKAWHDLIDLIRDEDTFLRVTGGSVLGYVFPYVPDKKEAWKDLIRLVHDKEASVRQIASYAISIAFPYVSNKKHAYQDILKLSKDKNNDLRASANYSLGKAHILKAAEAKSEKDLKEQLEKALVFFQKSSEDITYFSPSRFCLPFYRSFYTIIFEKEEIETKVQNYLAEAKSAVEGSNSKEKLLEAVENLGNALKEVQNTRNFDAIKSALNAYQQYCDRACELLDATEEKAPGASRLIRKGLPMIDERIKGIIAEIQEKAKAACQQSIGTQVEEIACAANRDIQKWHIDNQEQMSWAVDNLIFSLSTKILNIPENKKILDKIEKIQNEGNMIKQYQDLAVVVGLIPTIVHRGDVFNISGVTTSDNSQTIIKGNEITNNPEKSSIVGFEPAKKSWIDNLNSSATVAAFIGFLAVETGTYFYPLSYNHLISVVAAAISFTIVAMLNRR